MGQVGPGHDAAGLGDRDGGYLVRGELGRGVRGQLAEQVGWVQEDKGLQSTLEHSGVTVELYLVAGLEQSTMLGLQARR